MGTLYGEMTATDWRRAKHLEAHEIPRTLIMLGEDWNPPERMAELEEFVDVVIARPRWNVLIGDSGGCRVGLANVCWAPMAAVVAHQFFAMGTEQVVLVGYFGGLDRTLGYGQVLVVEAATGEDGASRAYSTAEQRADQDLVTKASALLAQRGLPYASGRIVTTDAMLLEDRATIDRWVAEGFAGVDGETAAVFAVAQRFRCRAVALLTCSDLLVAGDTLASDDTVDVVIEVALELATGSVVVPTPSAARTIVK